MGDFMTIMIGIELFSTIKATCKFEAEGKCRQNKCGSQVDWNVFGNYSFLQENSTARSCIALSLNVSKFRQSVNTF